MARMKYAERKKLATEYDNYCEVTKTEPTIPRFIEWLGKVKDIWLMSLANRGEMVRKTVELERAEAQARMTADAAGQKEPQPEGGVS